MNFSNICEELKCKYKNFKCYEFECADEERYASFSFVNSCLTNEDIIKNKLLNFKSDIFNNIRILIDVGKIRTFFRLKITPTFKRNDNYYDFDVFLSFGNINIFANPNKIFKYIESANKIISNLSVTDKELIKCFKKNRSFLIKRMNPPLTKDFKNIENIFYEKIKRYNLITKDNISDFIFDQNTKKVNHSEIDIYSFLFSLIFKRRIKWNFLSRKIFIKT
jgi:hypothetical protein